MKKFCTIIALAIIASASLFIFHNRDLRTRAESFISRKSPELKLISYPRSAAQKTVNGAKMEVIRGVSYDASYVSIRYPGGDVPSEQGACTDVIIRALRNAGYDLQKLIHEDMVRHFDLYPKNWGLRSPDSNIDHRRVPNHIAFMKRFAQSLPLATIGRAAGTWQPGDLVYWNLDGRLTHCGVISNERNADGLPLVIHNIGPCANQQDCLTSWEIIGHFRYPQSAQRTSAGP